MSAVAELKKERTIKSRNIQELIANGINLQQGMPSKASSFYSRTRVQQIRMKRPHTHLTTRILGNYFKLRKIRRKVITKNYPLVQAKLKSKDSWFLETEKTLPAAIDTGMWIVSKDETII